MDLTIDITYLKDKQSKTRASSTATKIILAYIIPQLREGVPIYVSKLAAGFLKEKFREFHIDPRILNVVKDRRPSCLEILKSK